MQLHSMLAMLASTRRAVAGSSRPQGYAGLGTEQGGGEVAGPSGAGWGGGGVLWGSGAGQGPGAGVQGARAGREGQGLPTRAKLNASCAASLPAGAAAAR